ncbi:hypothetical protein AMTR_s00012p00028450 [Amborella trichopoda]|uniref:Uncharacterized protein n=1 Tax=Amborella trichopoda TaxID=13333 RepID=W1PJ21_AMBTC|nr:hypothetical protein AMTR_s00012p00028450 [Amborella trichopoda]
MSRSTAGARCYIAGVLWLQRFHCWSAYFQCRSVFSDCRSAVGQTKYYRRAHWYCQRAHSECRSALLHCRSAVAPEASLPESVVELLEHSSQYAGAMPVKQSTDGAHIVTAGARIRTVISHWPNLLLNHA